MQTYVKKPSRIEDGGKYLSEKDQRIEIKSGFCQVIAV
jgi:hypothetical protein